jgi:hypothetical protein
MARRNTTGIDPKRVREVMELHKVTRWTAHRWLKANDVPPPGAVDVRLCSNGRFWYHRLDRVRPPRHGPFRSLQCSRSFLKRADMLATSGGYSTEDLAILQEISERAAEMCSRWQSAESQCIENAGGVTSSTSH